MSIYIDYMIELGLDVVKDKVTDIKEQHRLKENLRLFIKKRLKIDELPLVEAIDIQGIFTYISGNLLDDVKIRLFGKKSEREIARKTIINKTVFYSQAKTATAKREVIKLTSDILNILREFYRQKVPQSTLFAATEIVDDVEDFVKEQMIVHRKLIVNEVSEVVKGITEYNIMSIDKNIELIKNGRIDIVESNMTSLFKSVSSEHPLFPDYGFVPEMTNGNMRILSKPLSSVATMKYPPQMQCSGTMKLGNQPIEEFSTNTIAYANRHQIPIFLNIHNAKKFLGDKEDPVQQEANELVGKAIVIPPKPFPNSCPCSIIVDGNTEFDYILLRTQEIMEDNTMIISNEEQEKSSFKISMQINIDESKTNFNFHIEDAKNIDMLRYLCFMKKLSTGSNLIVKDLSEGQNLMEGTLAHFDYEKVLETLDQEIAFFENVISIENYFGKPLNIPNEIRANDFENINYIAELINGNEYCENWTKVEFTFNFNEELKNKIIEMDDLHCCISYIGSVNIPLFGEQYCLSVKRVFNNVQINNFEKLKNKAEVLDSGDPIKIEYRPGENNGIGTFIDTLQISADI